MTPQDFIAKWRASPRDERRHSHSHFNDLCALLGVDDPATAGDDGFTFEKGASKATGGSGWADVWRRGCFGWEYKGLGVPLEPAYRQLLGYKDALENPPLLITSDMERIVIHTNWTNTVQEVTTLALDDLLDGAKRDLLHAAFTDPERLKPRKTRQTLTEEAASRFVALAQRLRERGHAAGEVAHFVNRLVFCMFAEDVGLLPDNLFLHMLEAARPDPDSFAGHAATLFAAMRTGGLVGFQRVDWFNGGLFDDDRSLPLERTDIADLLDAARLDWSSIDPSILGTLFERGLDPAKRSQLGAHYTDRDKIMKIVNPVVVEPLLAEWAGIRTGIEAALAREASAKSPAAATRAHNQALAARTAFLERLKDFRILDPACGSGNFLYLALRALKDIEHRVNVEAEALGLPRTFPAVGPEAVRGIELNPYAAELARVSVWIGEIQWMRANGYDTSRNPILRPLDTIECRDAILNEDGSRAEWPKADVVIGNPPFLGNKRMNDGLGREYVRQLRAAYRGDLEGGVDLVVYWFAKAWEYLRFREVRRAGLVATNSIRQPKNWATLKDIVRNGQIFDAWSDEEWVIEGASVRVSLICFRKEKLKEAKLDGHLVGDVAPDLTSQEGFTKASVRRLKENARRCFEGFALAGPFDLDRITATEFLSRPLNPNGQPNSVVIRSLRNGRDLVQGNRDRFVVDFGQMSLAEAALYEGPFQHVSLHVQPIRKTNNREARRRLWWVFGEARPGLRKALLGKYRFIAILKTAKHCVPLWCHVAVACDGTINIVARDDDTTFGILHSRFHELWSLRMGTSLEDRPRYTPSTTFETFPFPEGLTPDIPAADYAGDPRAQAIAAAAARLNQLRETWLNPPDLVAHVPEVVPGYPDRLLPVDDAAAAVLKKRTLTNLYNARPAWLDQAHRALDAAVADAYGWGADWRAGMDDDAILARLFALNQARA